ncbi:hypothetical protein [Streptomyces griseoaurantiacus]|uniref:hypothetical protein n=1 Tax=Streptomyces griseoaurantiacus TaxID=68213 RepID=UPI0030E22473
MSENSRGRTSIEPAERRGGYSPQGYRPEPTVAPQTPAPGTPADDTPAAQKKAAEAERSRLYWFLHVCLRGDEQASQGHWVELGRTSGRAELAIEYGHLDAARKEFERMRTMAERWSSHPGYRQAVEHQA